ncbi:gamma-glutamyl-gamma-aminobutyrate hydrolase family protein [Pseudaquabacterium rugosum]|uniref:Gamma-glutamyl-gamma-aminobutyrate hydrolase family protein n=1 Tax=Pseudaquabacterium rugosum TaxID=2984194 RepID=A0ABU9B7I6_9BURK
MSVTPDRPLLVGVSARIHHPDTPVLDLGGIWTKTLHYMEQSVALWLMKGRALPVMVPAFEADSLVHRQLMDLPAYAATLDGLVLQGGADVSPRMYGEAPLRAEWSGDAIRDAYEIELIQAFVRAGKPVFGICRGLQILNVAFGGSLYQDLPTQAAGPVTHFDDARYERNGHPLALEPDGWLAGLYADHPRSWVNSIHHQAIHRLAPGFRIEARCPEDGLIEAVSRPGGSFLAGVQWHPEFPWHAGEAAFDDRPLLNDFLQACRQVRDAGRSG